MDAVLKEEALARPLSLNPSNSSPILEERLAIELTNSLRAASIGLRGYRRRPWMGRVLDVITGRGREHVGSMVDNIVHAQRAQLQLLEVLLDEQTRSKECMRLVLGNLEYVNGRMRVMEREIGRQWLWLRALRDDVRKIAERVESLSRRLDREAAVRRMGEHYKAGNLFPNASPLLAATYYLAFLGWQFWDAEKGTRSREWKEEWKYGLSVVQQRLPGEMSEAFSEELAIDLLSGLSEPELEQLLFLLDGQSGIAMLVYRLAEKKLARFPLEPASAKETLDLVRRLYDPDGEMLLSLKKPLDFVESLARALLPDRLPEPLPELVPVKETGP